MVLNKLVVNLVASCNGKWLHVGSKFTYMNQRGEQLESDVMLDQCSDLFEWLLVVVDKVLE